ncbi:ABC transporter ATP-binding protein [Flavobacteriaceae bacterium]|nr:ABC transporter ATP-binding protein [Flavobacteriaceae bacterium]
MLDVLIHSFSYQKELVLSHVNIQANKGDHIGILGESGCGKTTLLHLIYGLLTLESGHIKWQDEPVLGPESVLIPGAPNMKLVTQEFDLMPVTTVADNVATHLPRFNQKKRAARINELLDVVGLSAQKDQLVKTLSGGQKQRVALAKALAVAPEVLLLDEPFSHIDMHLRTTLRRSLYRYLKINNITCITATHDAEEAMAFADSVVVLGQGTVAAQGAPQELYQSISSAYLAGFFGEYSYIPQGVFGQRELYLLPHQIKRTIKQTPLLVRVTNNYFKGHFTLIAAEATFGKVYFAHHKSIEIGKSCFLALLKIKP